MKRAGYAFRQKYAKFLYRYKMLCDVTWPHYKGALLFCGRYYVLVGSVITCIIRVHSQCVLFYTV